MQALWGGARTLSRQHSDRKRPFFRRKFQLTDADQRNIRPHGGRHAARPGKNNCDQRLLHRNVMAIIRALQANVEARPTFFIPATQRPMLNYAG